MLFPEPCEPYTARTCCDTCGKTPCKPMEGLTYCSSWIARKPPEPPQPEQRYQWVMRLTDTNSYFLTSGSYIRAEVDVGWPDTVEIVEPYIPPEERNK